MTRKFFHLTLVLVFSMLTACSIFQSEQTTSANEIEGINANVESEETDDFSDLEDIDKGEDDLSDDGAVAAAPGAKDDSYSDIEDFNEDLIEGELSSAKTPAPADPGTEKELDIENADIDFSATATATDTEPQTSGVVSSGGEAFGGPNKITNLEYKSFESGGTVVITAENTFLYKVRAEPEYNQTIIEIADVTLPEKFKLPYIAKDFGQPVATINAYQDAGATTARIVIQYKNGASPTVEQKQNSLLVMNNGTGAPNMQMGSDDVDSTIGANGVVLQPAPANKTISLEMDEVEIREVIKLIADEVNINVIIDAAIKGPTSVHLKGVPWEQALSSILKAHSLGYARQGNILRIAPEETLTREASNYADRLTKEEQARKTLEPRKVKIFSVNYADVDILATKIVPLLTLSTGAGGVAGTVMGDKRSNAIIVTDFEEVLGRVEQVIRSLDIPPLQVLIEGKIIEANESFTREFGLRWTANSSFKLEGKEARLQTTGSQTSNKGLTGGLFSSLNVGTFDVLGDLTAILGIFESESKVKVLSSPKIVAMNKESAMIKQSTALPIVTTTVNGNASQNSVTFQEAVLSLEVTPQVTFNGDTILQVKVQRDVPGAIVQSLSRGINKREATGKVLVKDGQTLVLGGIYNIDETSTETGIPYLKDIPILGYLFKFKSKEVIKNELVIFLTPKIINPDLIKQMAKMGDVLQNNSVTPGAQPPKKAEADFGGELETL